MRFYQLGIDPFNLNELKQFGLEIWLEKYLQLIRFIYYVNWERESFKWVEFSECVPSKLRGFLRVGRLARSWLCDGLEIEA